MSSPESPGTSPGTSDASADNVTLGGRYEVHRRLARGGMADVFLARDSALDRPVAVKVLFPEFAADPAFVERFRREAQAAANLTHPNIVGVYDWGTESGTYYIVMEFVDGQSLAQIIRSSGPLEPRRTAEVAFEVAAGLGFAHQRGVVHRDVKPGNVLINSHNVAKVTDFGIARALSSPSEDLTQAGNVMGTATYFSPEQAQGFDVDARSDLYSLGVVMFEVLCGRPPFSGDTPVSIAYKHVQEPPPKPSTIISDMPAGLEAIIGKLLSKRPDDRYLSADDLRADLKRWLAGEETVAERSAIVAPVSDATVAHQTVDPDATTVAPAVVAPVAAPPVVPPPVAAPPATPPPAPVVVNEPEEEPRRTGLFVGTTVVLLALLAGLAFWLVKSLGDENSSLATVPPVIGLERDEATAKLTEAGFNPVVLEERTDEAPSGVVFEQNPDANTDAEEGSDVTIKVSIGSPLDVVPEGLIGQAYQGVEELLKRAGFIVKIEFVDSDEPKDNVVATDPAPGEDIEMGGTITLSASKGPSQVDIPEVAGSTLDEARKALTDAGFEVGALTEAPSDTIAAGLVITTDPVGAAAKGTKVNIIQSTGPKMVTVPSVKGRTESDAVAAVRAAGLKEEIKTKALPAGDSDNGRVVAVSPEVGTSVAPNSTVTLTIGVASNQATTTTSSSTTTTSP